jgi:anti-sigma factor (TIGR02949 family)
MICDHYRDSLGARLDGELQPDEERDIDRHVATCDSCARELGILTETHRLLSENLMRHRAPDVLKARIRGAIVEASTPRAAMRSAPAWWRQAAAVIAIAVASSALTMVGMNHASSGRATDDLLSSHVRSLQPGHLTDVVSTNQHQVKPWFNGRVDVSPSVPNLDSLGFPLVGGRTDYVGGRAVPVVVYGRRQHMINVYAWPSSSDAETMKPNESTRQGYHLVRWTSGGVDYTAISDLNAAELRTFVTSFRTH